MLTTRKLSRSHRTRVHDVLSVLTRNFLFFSLLSPTMILPSKSEENGLTRVRLYLCFFFQMHMLLFNIVALSHTTSDISCTLTFIMRLIVLRCL